MEYQCPVCYNHFQTSRKDKIYCSPECRNNYTTNRKQYYLRNRERYIKQNLQWYREHRHPCPTCGILISYTAKHCAKHAGTGRTGTENHGWKGGIARTGGYVKVLKREHPRANSGGYVSEHIIVWEQTHGIPLPDGWVVHHLNGIKTDNRSSNLIGLSNKKHMAILQAKAKRIQELEALLNKYSILM
uniref:Putative homing endonuclease n=1 Tax=viral metagenome TaxID=1070528 RepID=A0A6H1ZSD9_9ZZZZ